MEHEVRITPDHLITGDYRGRVNMENAIAAILKDSVDFHIHISPDPYEERIADAREVALQAKNLEMKGIVLKSHHYPTAPVASLTGKIVEGIQVLGSLTLNDGVGGINPHAVEASAKMGARVVWMPTVSASHERRRKGLGEGIALLGGDGKLLPEVRAVLALIKEFELALGTGHLTREEIIPLFHEAMKTGVSRFVVTHPLKVAGTSVDLDTQRTLAEKGAFIEHCFVATMSRSGKIDPARIVEAIRYVGVAKCILSTDLGRSEYPPPWEGMQRMLTTLKQNGLSERELSILVKENPCKLLNLE